MGKYFVCWLGLALMFAPQLRADVTLTNGSAAAFSDAVDATVADGGGTITITTPILLSSTNDATESDFDGESVVVLTSTATNSMFIVQDDSWSLSGFTVQNGVSTNGGAIYIFPDGDLIVTNCVFSNNVARGPDGFLITTGTNSVTGTNSTGGTNVVKITGITPGLPARGGAIFSLGSLAIFNCQFFTNSAIAGAGGSGSPGSPNGGAGAPGGPARGGGIYSEGLLTIGNTTFSGNLATGGNGGTNSGTSTGSGGIGGSSEGGGLFSIGGSEDEDVTITNCTFSQNVALGGSGGTGGIYKSGMGRDGHNGGNAFGGGIDNLGSMVLTNSTFFENNAIGGTGGNGADGGGRGGVGGSGGSATGGGLYSTGMVSVVSCTFSMDGAVGGTNGPGGAGIVPGKNGKRGASHGGNIANVAKKKSHNTFTLQNSIIGFNLAGGGGYGPVIDGGFNLSADKSIKLKKANNSFPKTNPLLGDLAANGGPTPTIALLSGSPAIDKIPSTNAPPIDQRGKPRPEPTNGMSDIGAYELDLLSAQISGQPANAIVTVGSNVTFSVTAFGAAPLFYQWIFSGSVTNSANGFTNSTLVITNASLTNAGTFQVIVSNAFNSVTSDVVTLTVNSVSNSAPVITLQPVSQTINSNATATLTVTASGTAPLFYQWFFVGATFTPSAITNATHTTLTVANFQATNQGIYFVTVTNNFGSTNSALVTLLINTNSGGGITPPNVVQSSAIAVPQEPHLMPLTAAQNGDIPATVNLAFPSQADATYILEYKKSLTDPAWIPIATNTGTGDWMTNRMPTTDQPTGFYRVRSP